MRSIIILLCAIVINACNQDSFNLASGDLEFDSLKAQLVKKGAFEGLDGPTSGMGSVYRQAGILYIVLNPFQTHRGQDLKVYLATDDDAMEFIRVGDLQSISGRQVYPVPGNPNIDDYKFIHIWSELYTVDYTKADVARAEIK